MKLKRYTQKLAEYLFVTLGQEGLEVLRDMTDESFMTDIDIMCKEYEEAMAERDKKLAEQGEKLAERDKKLAKQDEKLAEMTMALDRKLIMQVTGNYKKGKLPEEIADDLMEPVEKVRQICEIIDSLAPEDDLEQIYQCYLRDVKL